MRQQRYAQSFMTAIRARNSFTLSVRQRMPSLKRQCAPCSTQPHLRVLRLTGRCLSRCRDELGRPASVRKSGLADICGWRAGSDRYGRSRLKNYSKSPRTFQRRPYFCLFRRKRREMVHSSHNKQMDRIGLSVCSIRHSADA